MILDTIKAIVSIKDLRKKIIATLLLVLVYKLLSVIPIPGVNTDGISAIINGQKGLSFFSALMGGGLENFSIILMGIMNIKSLMVFVLTIIFVPNQDALIRV